MLLHVYLWGQVVDWTSKYKYIYRWDSLNFSEDSNKTWQWSWTIVCWKIYSHLFKLSNINKKHLNKFVHLILDSIVVFFSICFSFWHIKDNNELNLIALFNTLLIKNILSFKISNGKKTILITFTCILRCNFGIILLVLIKLSLNRIVVINITISLYNAFNDKLDRTQGLQ